MTVWISALCGLLQIAVLPGLIIQQLVFRHRSRISVEDRILLVFCSSAVSSFLLLLLLHQIGLHQRWVWSGVAIAECAAYCLLLRGRGEKSVMTGSDETALPQHWLNRSSVALYGIGLLVLTSTVISHWPGTLQGWDAIVSWNRWAQDWARGDWPFLTWGYAQLVPALWSVIYLWQDSTETEIFVRAWLGFFPVMLIFAMWARSGCGKICAPLLAGAALVWLLLGTYSPVLDSGYVDVPLTCFIFLTAHWVLRAEEDPGNGKQWLLCAAIAAAGAILTKASGMLALVFWLYGAWMRRGQMKENIAPFGLLFSAVAVWYGLHWLNGTHENVAAYATNQIYGSETLLQRVVRAFTRTLPALMLPGSGAAVLAIVAALSGLGVAAAMTVRTGRFHAIPAVIYSLGWAALLSYDGRNLLPAVPSLLLAIFTGWEKLWSWRRSPAVSPGSSPRANSTSKTNGAYWKMMPVAILGVLVLVGTFPVENKKVWEEKNNALRKEAGFPEINQQLINFVNGDEFSGLIYTTYPQLASIQELRRALFVDYGASHMQPQTAAALRANAPLCSILRTFPRFETIHYLLLHESVYPVVIANALENSSLDMVMSWPELRLMKVDC